MRFDCEAYWRVMTTKSEACYFTLWLIHISSNGNVDLFLLLPQVVCLHALMCKEGIIFPIFFTTAAPLFTLCFRTQLVRVYSDCSVLTGLSRHLHNVSPHQLCRCFLQRQPCNRPDLRWRWYKSPCGLFEGTISRYGLCRFHRRLSSLILSL